MASENQDDVEEGSYLYYRSGILPVRIANSWALEAFRLGVTAAVNPFEYAKLLIQIGFEPIAPRPSRTLLGRPVLALPNIFEYIGHIYKKKGFYGLYRGTTARVCGSFISSYVYDGISEALPFGRESKETNSETEEDRVAQFFQETAKNMLAQCAAVIASHPFQVISVRTFAQFVGSEEQYIGLFSSIKEIYKHDGIGGFFAGLVPRILGEMFNLWLASCLTFVINTYLIKDKDFRVYARASVSYIAVAVTYPFMVVSRVMSVQNSGLAAGSPPYMPVYQNWTDCWSQLKARNQLKRGSSVLFRYYTGPYTMTRHGKPYVITSRNLVTPSATKHS